MSLTLSAMPELETAPITLTETGLVFSESTTFAQWQAIGDTLRRMEKSVMWWIGDWVRFGEAKWGEKYKQAIEVTGYSYETIKQAKWVCSKFELCERSHNLGYTAHLAAAGLSSPDRAEVLSTASTEGWSVRDVKAEVNRRKNCVGTAVSSATCTTNDLKAILDRGLKFGTIYADPPWLYGNQGTRAATGNHYGGMTVEEIAAMPIKDMVADQAHCHLWTTNGFLPDSFAILEAWGFEYKSCFVWCKPQMGIGNYWRVSHEFLLLGVRGGLTFNDHGLKSYAEISRTVHSAKPEQVRQMIEKASPGPYLELFGRRTAENWTTFGNQIERNVFNLDLEKLERLK